jgi:hypothetical protein
MVQQQQQWPGSARAAPADAAEPELALECYPEDNGACTYGLAPDPTARALLELWRHGKLCDAVVVSAEGAELPAHRLMLAASSGFFRAMFTVRTVRRAALDASGCSSHGAGPLH